MVAIASTCDPDPAALTGGGVGIVSHAAGTLEMPAARRWRAGWNGCGL